jgi:hypothetical protein
VVYQQGSGGAINYKYFNGHAASACRLSNTRMAWGSGQSSHATRPAKLCLLVTGYYKLSFSLCQRIWRRKVEDEGRKKLLKEKRAGAAKMLEVCLRKASDTIIGQVAEYSDIFCVFLHPRKRTSLNKPPPARTNFLPSTATLYLKIHGSFTDVYWYLIQREIWIKLPEKREH